MLFTSGEGKQRLDAIHAADALRASNIRAEELFKADDTAHATQYHTVHALLAEDNVTDVMLIDEAVKASGLPICLHVMKDGEEAFEFIQQAETSDQAPCPGVAFLDLNLPKKNGLEILERIRNSPKCKGIPVIIVTASDSPADRKESARRGASRYFRKPMDLDEFLKLGKIIEEVLADVR